ncbi:DNA repair protein RecN [Nitratidesulfovibrio sp. SRB-5]|uniref:DNA repair protein RecN n=1 Tax=Nitratidesulfovibrio sp. SRB-5 TaxID=2872636 RepID=UPI001CBF2996|nr:AAA family ATPase [Nitratidesulfovibrio sp. SRB-5]MBZ2173534.1 AAA family ATPase [Nitratidesulfovibrio sp. SRB-5]
MLEYLRIRDLALIEDMELDFAPGLNALTGETGAGKSFILKALNFLIGDRLASDMVRPGKEKAHVEALFALPDGDMVLRRELTADTGRSRLFINDRLSSQDAVRDMRASLVVHTSQHGQQKLLQPAFQARLLDEFLNRPDLLAARDDAVKGLREVAARREELAARARSLEDRRDVLEFQQREIDKVAPEAGEEDRLEERRRALRDVASAQQAQERALAVLRGEDGPGVAEALGLLERALDGLARLHGSGSGDATTGSGDASGWAGDVATISAFRQGLSDLERRLRRRPAPAASDGDDDMDVEAIEKRLYELAQLKRKLRRTLDEIVDLRREIEENLSFLDACRLDLRTLEREEEARKEELCAVLAELNPARQEAAIRLAQALEGELAGLGFSEHVRVTFDFTPHEPWPGCVEDRARLMWVPNPGQPPQPLDRIASGGELSRFLLAVVGLMARDETATLIFDEVDSGVGGLTLNRVSERLAALAGRRQVILITHWPQLAARAGRHFQVSKEVADNATFTLCRRLDGEDIRKELARMAGGGGQGEAMARELIS